MPPTLSSRNVIAATGRQQLLDLDWIKRMPEPRIVRLTPAGQGGLADTFGLTRIPEPGR